MTIEVAALYRPLRKAQELCESRGGRPGLPSLISLRFLVDVKQHFNFNKPSEMLRQQTREAPRRLLFDRLKSVMRAVNHLLQAPDQRGYRYTALFSRSLKYQPSGSSRLCFVC